MHSVTCVNPDCDYSGDGVLVPDDGTLVKCGGCDSVLREENPGHPDYPQPPEPEPSLEELVDQRLRDLGII